MIRVSVSPNLIEWALERANLRKEDLTKKFKQLPEWGKKDQAKPTLRQLERFAREVRVPFGYMLLDEPPDEPVPIPDFRTLASQQRTRLSPDLIDTILACQERQDWYRDYLRESDEVELLLVGSANLGMSHEKVAKKMRDILGFKVEDRIDYRTWDEALRDFIIKVEDARILVMVNGIVMNNTHRRLDPKEFRGFALSDRLAPLVFINGADSKSAQMFTLAHELAHIWLGKTALSNLSVEPRNGFKKIETWCNGVAAEFLVPLANLREELKDEEDLEVTLPRLSQAFKVSELVVLRRLLDAEHISRIDFENAWAAILEQLHDNAQGSRGGGDFYKTAPMRVSRRFARAMIASANGGQTLSRDAYRMLGVSKTETFDKLGRELKVIK